MKKGKAPKARKNTTPMGQGLTPGMTPGAGASLSNSTSVGAAEVQNAKENMGTSGTMAQTPTTGMTAGTTGVGLTNSTSVGQAEVQHVKKKVKESGNMNPTNTGLY
ncbi:hypothetical protein [Anaeromicrobium sediminis]|uniref:Uncharacterized protein n=1 Tax=Anaeromicrobium sediminis TaxID=1478221 RepID=A0A267MCR8_9FIRM|nr:hypothetical protein [Anaeromicrobium sediminis]PAB56718.1 hypothetical protein CCE28_20430 [Anaeromicrobium sediminis]